MRSAPGGLFCTSRPVPLPFRFVCALLLAAVVAGCGGGRALPASDGLLSQSALRSHLRALTGPLVPADSAQATQRARYAAGRMQAAGLMPVLDGSFFLRSDGASPGPLFGPARSHVLGYVAGRHPSYYDVLVLVAADLNGVGAAATLEAARVLAEEARTTQVPERSVLFALWAPPRTGALGLHDYLANPTWALENVYRVLLGAADTASATESRRLLAARGIASEVVTVADPALADAPPPAERARALFRAVRLADALLAQVHAAALGPSPEGSTPDS